MAKLGNGIKFILSLVIGTALALVLVFFVTVGVFFAILAGIGGLIAGLVIFRGTSGKDEYLPGVSGITKEMHRRALEEDREKLGKHRAASIRIEDIRKDPKDLKPSRPFLTYYPDTAMTIIHRYSEITSRA